MGRQAIMAAGLPWAMGPRNFEPPGRCGSLGDGPALRIFANNILLCGLLFLFRKADEGLLSMINNQTPLRKHRIAYG